MFCKLTRWLISRAEDRGTKAPRFALHHAERCGACRDFARFAASLPSRLSGEKPAFLAAVPDFPLNEAQWVEAEAGRKKQEILRRRLILHPFPAAVVALIVVAAVLLVFRVVRPRPSPSPFESEAAIAALKSMTAAPDRFQGVVTEAESPLARERQILERSVLSAVEYFQARLNIRIERKKEAPKTV
jgi:hypothetical protein